MTLVVEFCGEEFVADPSTGFVIGREADLTVDENRFLHRRFLSLAHVGGMWTLSNVGAQLSATVSDADGRMEAYLAPGATIPLVFNRTRVRFTAGPTTYEFSLVNDEPLFVAPPQDEDLAGETTAGATRLTPDQKLLIVALAEHVLSGDGRAFVTAPSLADVARRLDWTQTKLNRKLDNVCQKFARLGVRGLHGGPDKLASNRRSRLVEYALAVRLVTRDDLAMLDRARSDLVPHPPTA